MGNKGTWGTGELGTRGTGGHGGRRGHGNCGHGELGDMGRGDRGKGWGEVGGARSGGLRRGDSGVITVCAYNYSARSLLSRPPIAPRFRAPRVPLVLPPVAGEVGGPSGKGRGKSDGPSMRRWATWIDSEEMG